MKHLLNFGSQGGIEVSRVLFLRFASKQSSQLQRSFAMDSTTLTSTDSSISKSFFIYVTTPTPTKYNATTHVLNIVTAKEFDISVHSTASSIFSYVHLPALIYAKYRQTFSIPYADQTLHGPDLCFVSRKTLQENPATIDRLIIEKCFRDPTTVTHRSLTASAP
jgi:hypothetical protein